MPRPRNSGIGIRTIRTWVWLYACCGFQALGHSTQTRTPLPCLSHDQMQLILATLRDKSPDQLQFEFAYRSLKIVRPWILGQFPSPAVPVHGAQGSCGASASPRSALSSSPTSKTPTRCGSGSKKPTPPSPGMRRSREPCCSWPTRPAGPRTTTGALRGVPGARRPFVQQTGEAVPVEHAVRDQPLGSNVFQDPCRNRHRRHICKVPAADSGPDGC